MLAIRLPTDIEERLEHLDDLEDLYLAEQRLIDHRAGRSQTCTGSAAQLRGASCAIFANASRWRTIGSTKNPRGRLSRY